MNTSNETAVVTEKFRPLFEMYLSRAAGALEALGWRVGDVQFLRGSPGTVGPDYTRSVAGITAKPTPALSDVFFPDAATYAPVSIMLTLETLSRPMEPSLHGFAMTVASHSAGATGEESRKPGQMKMVPAAELDAGWRAFADAFPPVHVVRAVREEALLGIAKLRNVRPRAAGR